MEWINCLIWTFSQYLCPTAFHTLQEWFYPYKKMVIQLASRRTLCSCCLSHWVVYVAWCNYFCSTVTGKQYQDNAIRLFARFVGGGAKRRMTFQTTPVLCFAYVSRRTKSKRGWSLRVSKWSDFFLCNPFDLSGSPNEGWLYACRSHADVLRGSSRVLAPQTSAEPKDKFLSHCSQISAGDHMQIIGDPIGAV